MSLDDDFAHGMELRFLLALVVWHQLLLLPLLLKVLLRLLLKAPVRLEAKVKPPLAFCPLLVSPLLSFEKHVASTTKICHRHSDPATKLQC